jgi:hypothetical protein
VDDYEIGYGKPPKKSRFKPGTSGNPRGRPIRDRTMLGEIVKAVLDAPVQYREKGRARIGTRREVTLKLLIQQAIKGDVAAADIVQRRYAVALRQAGTGSSRLLIRDWLPDHPGQTAEQKTRDLGSAVEGATPQAQSSGFDTDEAGATDISEQASPAESGHEIAR